MIGGFENFADRLFQHAKKKLQESNNYITRIFAKDGNLSLRIYRQSVENLFKSGVEEDGMWIGVAKAEPDNGRDIKAKSSKSSSKRTWMSHRDMNIIR